MAILTLTFILTIPSLKVVTAAFLFSYKDFSFFFFLLKKYFFKKHFDKKNNLNFYNQNI